MPTNADEQIINKSLNKKSRAQRMWPSMPAAVSPQRDNEPPPSKLSTVYEYIDRRYYQRAVEFITQLLGAYPASQILRALKAYVFYRTSKREEALALVMEVVANAHTDEQLLTPVGHILQTEASMGNMIEPLVDLYQKAHAHDPKNLQVAEQLFYVYLRTQKYPQMQKTATSISKINKDPLYKLWMAAAIYLQLPPKGSDVSTMDAGQKLQFQLLGAMLKKYLEDPEHPHKDHAILLYGEVLLRNQKIEDAAQLCLSESTAKCFNQKSECLLQLAHIYQTTEQFGHLLVVSKILINTVDADNWEYYRLYLSSLQSCISKSPESNKITLQFGDNTLTHDCDTTVSEAVQFLKGLRESVTAQNTTKKPPRSCNLALMELCKLVINKTISKSDVEISVCCETLYSVVAEHSVEYFSSNVCFLDIMEYCDVLHSYKEGGNNQYMKQLIAKITEQCNTKVEGDQKKQDLRECSRGLLLEKIKFSTHLEICNLDDAQLLALAVTYWNSYNKYKHLAEGLESSERPPADDFIVLFTNICLFAYNKTKETRAKIVWILRVLSVLDITIQQSENNYGFKLFATRLYALLGCPKDNHLKSLDVKFIQNDTLSYLIVPDLIKSGNEECMRNWGINVTMFHRAFLRDFTDEIQRVMSAGAISRIDEVQQFQQTVGHSITSLEVQAEVLCGLVASATFNELNTVFKANSRYSDMRMLKQWAENNTVHSNEDHNVLKILLYHTKDSPAQSSLLSILLPVYSKIDIDTRVSAALLLLSYMFVLRAILADMEATNIVQQLKQASTKKQKGKGKKEAAVPVFAPQVVQDDSMPLDASIQYMQKCWDSSPYSSPEKHAQNFPLHESIPLKLTTYLLLLTAKICKALNDPENAEKFKDKQFETTIIDTLQPDINQVVATVEEFNKSVTHMLSVDKQTENGPTEEAFLNQNNIMSFLRVLPLWITFGNIICEEKKCQNTKLGQSIIPVFANLSSCVENIKKTMKDMKDQTPKCGHWAHLHMVDIDVTCDTLQLPADVALGVDSTKQQLNEYVVKGYGEYNKALSEGALECNKCARLLGKKK